MSRNEKGEYRIQIRSNNNLFEQYAQDMKMLNQDTKPLNYISLYYSLEELKDIIAKNHLKVYKYIAEKHPNKKIRTEFRIKSPASILEKSYMQTANKIDKQEFNPDNPIIIYDGAAFRIIIDHVEFEIAQTRRIKSDTTGLEHNAIRTKDNKILEICVGDYIDLGQNRVVEVTKDNLFQNYDGSLSIKLGANRYSLKNTIIQKRDCATLKQADYDVEKTLIECLIKSGYVTILERKKDFIKHPKHTYKFKNFNKDDCYHTFSKRMQQKVRYLSEHKDKIRYAKNKTISTSAYESLHYGAYDPQLDYYFEYQIRDFHMHNISENDPIIGHDTYKQLPIDITAKYRVPKAGVFNKFNKNGKFVYDYYFYEEDYMYKKIFKKSKEEVFKDIAKMSTGLDR